MVAYLGNATHIFPQIKLLDQLVVNTSILKKTECHVYKYHSLINVSLLTLNCEKKINTSSQKQIKNSLVNFMSSSEVKMR